MEHEIAQEGGFPGGKQSFIYKKGNAASTAKAITRKLRPSHVAPGSSQNVANSGRESAPMLQRS